jgi:hypothetical protein
MPRRTIQRALDDLLLQGLRSECSSSDNARKKIYTIRFNPIDFS